MAHQRKLIRDAVVARLLQAGTLAERRVFGSRAVALQPKELPAILVYSKSEQASISTEAPREYLRNLILSVELVAQAKDENALDDILDEFSAQVEKAIFNDETFDGVVSDTILTDTEMDILTDGENPIGGVKINFTMPYFERLPLDLTGDMDDFLRMSTKVDLPPADGALENDDLVDIPQS